MLLQRLAAVLSPPALRTCRHALGHLCSSSCILCMLLSTQAVGSCCLHPNAPTDPTLGHARPQATPLSQLPLEYVLAVIAAAAFPLYAWFDDASKQSWLAAEFWRD